MWNSFGRRVAVWLRLSNIESSTLKTQAILMIFCPSTCPLTLRPHLQLLSGIKSDFVGMFINFLETYTPFSFPVPAKTWGKSSIPSTDCLSFANYRLRHVNSIWERKASLSLYWLCLCTLAFRDKLFVDLFLFFIVSPLKTQPEESVLNSPDDEKEKEDFETLRIFDGNSSLRKHVFRTATLPKTSSAQQIRVSYPF